MGKLARINADARAQRERTITILAKALSGFLGQDQAICVEADGVKHIVFWNEGNVVIRVVDESLHPEFEDGLVLQARPPEEESTAEVAELTDQKEENSDAPREQIEENN